MEQGWAGPRSHGCHGIARKQLSLWLYSNWSKIQVISPFDCRPLVWPGTRQLLKFLVSIPSTLVSLQSWDESHCYNYHLLSSLQVRTANAENLLNSCILCRLMLNDSGTLSKEKVVILQWHSVKSVLQANLCFMAFFAHLSPLPMPLVSTERLSNPSETPGASNERKPRG